MCAMDAPSWARLAMALLGVSATSLLAFAAILS
jgi:hypothetical protein